MKKALITGITGQDGAYLAKLLIDKGYEVYGAMRRTSNLNLWRLEYLGISEKVKTIDFDLLEQSNILNVIKDIQPDEVYNLAAQSFVGTSFKQPLLTADTDAIGVLRILDALKTFKIDAKFYQASTSEMFGKVQETPQKETTQFYPRSPYGVSKLFAHWMTINYKESYNMFCCSGILFNHESPLRGPEFVTRKVCIKIAQFILGINITPLEIGNMDSKRDWGYAKEYVEGMYLIMQESTPDNFILSTGETHTVREFIEKAFEYVGIKIKWEGKESEEIGINIADGKTLIKVNPEFYRPSEVDLLIGDYTKAKTVLSWEPQTKFEDLVKLMTQAELNRLKNN